MTDYSTARSTNDIIELLKLIRGICCKFDVKSQKYVALAATFRQAFVYFQDNNTSNDDFFHHYKSLLATIQSFGGDDAIGVIPNFVDDELEAIAQAGGFAVAAATAAQQTAAKKTCQERFLAATMLGCTNLTKYEPLRRHLENQFAMGHDNYPKTLEGVLDLMNTFNTGPTPTTRRPPSYAAAASTPPPDGAAMFAQASDEIICHDCGRPGHVQRYCPDRRNGRHPAPSTTPAATTNPPTAAMNNVQIHVMYNEDYDDYYNGRVADEAIFFQNDDMNPPQQGSHPPRQLQLSPPVL